MSGSKYVYIAPGWTAGHGEHFFGPLAPCTESILLPALTNTFYIHIVAITNNIEDINYYGVVRIIFS